MSNKPHKRKHIVNPDTLVIWFYAALAVAGVLLLAAADSIMKGAGL